MGIGGAGGEGDKAEEGVGVWEGGGEEKREVSGVWFVRLAVMGREDRRWDRSIV